MTIGTESLLGILPHFVVDVSATRATYHNRGDPSSIDELTAALHDAATYRSPLAWILIVAAVAACVALMIRPILVIAVLIAASVLVFRATSRTAQRQRVAVLYQLDAQAARAFDSLISGLTSLGGSRAVWRITHEEVAQRPANATSVTRVAANVSTVEAANLLTNIVVPSLTAGSETLLFLPDGLMIRDKTSIFRALPYASVRVASETLRFSESLGPPADSHFVGQAWIYANKNGSPDKRRANNRQIPVLEYARITLSWHRSGFVLLASNVEAAQRFATALQALTQDAVTPSLKTIPELTKRRHEPIAPAETESALQVSIDRKGRLKELERDAGAVVGRGEHESLAQAPTLRPNAEWLEQGQTKTVHGFSTGDFVYVGSNLHALERTGIEPSLIDPALPVDPSSANTSGTGMTYWPSYGSIPPACRTAYLQWLAGGRKDSNAYIGYAFIFFYGLERRVYEFIKNRVSSADEVLAIGHEVARLLDLYAEKSGSFASHGESFLDLIASIEPRTRDLQRGSIRPGYGVPPRLKIALGECALDRRPIPTRLALDWARSAYFLNTPATRCSSEFELLFHVRYAKQFGDGLVIEPGKRLIDLSYRPASAALGPITATDRKIPDVTDLTRPLEKLLELARECSNALESFSRLLGKNPDARQSLSGFAVLPEELVERTPSSAARSLASLVLSRLDADGRAELAAGELLLYVAVAKPEKVSKNEAMLLAQALEKLGYGIEPDVRLGGPVYDSTGRVVVFRRLPDCPSVASDEYAAAALLIRLAAMVSAADDEVSNAERNLLESHIKERLQLSAGERQRLGAHLTWLLNAGLGTTGLKRRIEALPREARRDIGKLLVGVAASDGHIDPREMKILEKLFRLLELSAADLYRDVHSAQAGDEPILVDQPSSRTKAFAIPPMPVQGRATSAIDMDRVRLKMAETLQVSTLLASIFAEEEAPVTVPRGIAEVGTIGTLDAAHSELLRRLALRDRWPRNEVERLASELSLLTDGALETLNDYAYSTVSEPFWEDSDPVAINSNVARELIS